MSLTRLMKAARDGDLDHVRKNLGEAGKKDGGSETALMNAAKSGHADCVALLEKEMRMQNNWGQTALMWAAFYGKPECVKLLLSEIEMKTTKEWNGFHPGTTALMMAAEEGHDNLVPLLEKEIGMKDDNGWTALMLAARNGHKDCVRLLLFEAGKQSTKKWEIASDGKTVISPSGMTALMLAAHCNHPKLVKILLPYEQGLKDSEGHTAKWYANNGDPAGGDFTKVRELLKNEGTERIPPPLNPVEVPKLRECVDKLFAEVESLKKELASSKKAQKEAEAKTSQMNREVSSLKYKAQEAEKSLAEASNEVSFLKNQFSRTTRAMNREIEDHEARILSLENAQLESEDFMFANDWDEDFNSGDDAEIFNNDEF